MLLVVLGMGIAFAQTVSDADFDGNGRVGFSDFLLFAGKFGARQGDGKYEAKYDLDGDGEVGFSDFLAFAGFFGQNASSNQFYLTGHQIATECPSYVNIMFQVRDSLGYGVNFLTTDHFEVRENNGAVSPTESALHIRKRAAISYRLKTVLMLDTSTSVRLNLEQIKAAAIALVENMTAQQEIALYEFSDEPVLLQDFTDDVAVLTEAIRAIRLGFATTNLYGSLIAGSARWEDIYTLTEVQQGFLVLLTDGSDTQGSSTLEEALSARGGQEYLHGRLGK